ncbi:hypothetical protein HAX54_041893 [Datura stramonium]|uniref:Putative plant transposon protein domain-containing protein n=1 Tax=Datura stramonium TaxID=4076 RepID=A0ABS8W1M4_DATST|nr:hypothetical protein [Datura stramonium]
MSEAPGHYYPTIVCEFYANYIAVLEGLCKKRQKPLEVLTDGQPLWLVNTKDSEVHTNICSKVLVGSGLTSTIPNRGDNTLDEDRAVLVASLMSGFPLYMGVIITEEMNYREVKLSTSLHFPCLITQLCREAHVPILVGIDVETYATKKYDLEKSKDESIYELNLQKLILEVFGPSGQNTMKTETSTESTREATRGKLVYQAAPIHTFTMSTSGVTVTQPKGESTETFSSMPQSLQYAFTRVFRKADRQDKQLNLFDEQQGLFIDRAITATLEPYKHLHESEDDAPFVDLLGEKPKEAGKRLRNDIIDEGKSHKKKKHKHNKHEKAELKEFNNPVERHVTGATIHSESMTLAIPPPDIKATEATNASSGITPPQIVFRYSRV